MHAPGGLLRDHDVGERRRPAAGEAEDGKTGNTEHMGAPADHGLEINASSGLAPAPEDEPAEGHAEPERSNCESTDRNCFSPRRQPLPASERLLLLGRQRLAATPLAHGAAGAQAEVQIVEDFGGFVRHVSSL